MTVKLKVVFWSKNQLPNVLLHQTTRVGCNSQYYPSLIGFDPEPLPTPWCYVNLWMILLQIFTQKILYFFLCAEALKRPLLSFVEYTKRPLESSVCFCKFAPVLFSDPPPPQSSEHYSQLCTRCQLTDAQCQKAECFSYTSRCIYISVTSIYCQQPLPCRTRSEPLNKDFTCPQGEEIIVTYS